MDYGCPQITDPNILRTYINEEEFNIELLKDLKKLRPLTSIATGSQYCFYPARIVYRNNEIFVKMECTTTQLICFFKIGGGFQITYF